jgi:hypothetical protein
LLKCWRIPVVAAGAGLAVAKIEVGIKDGIAAGPAVGTHQVIIRIFGMIGFRGENSHEE